MLKAGLQMPLNVSAHNLIVEPLKNEDPFNLIISNIRRRVQFYANLQDFQPPLGRKVARSQENLIFNPTISSQCLAN